jgi:hypothetical protein
VRARPVDRFARREIAERDLERVDARSRLQDRENVFIGKEKRR